MITALKLAYKNLVGAGLRTWLNVFVLSFVYVIIVWHYGLLDGWNRQAKKDTTAWETGNGQYWHKAYDPYDPFTLFDSHGAIPASLDDGIRQGLLMPLLISQATIYPEGRIQGVILKGIDPAQQILQIPSALLKNQDETIPVIIGTRMASSTGLKKGEQVTVRWRDTHGTFDAADAHVVGIFRTNVPSVDQGQLWIPIERLRRMKQMPCEATLLVRSERCSEVIVENDWIFRSSGYLLSDIQQTIQSKSAGASIFYIILMMLAMLAVFDTQVLSIFRRQREIGTYIALGMTRGQVVGLFTTEGTMHAILAAILGAAYGIPLLSVQAINGLALPEGMDAYGMAIAEKIYPAYSLGLILTTVLIVWITTTIVSYLPSRKISKMNPTDAIKGKIQ